MGKSPAFQFYPNDWSRDLEEHPLEIEGAWIRICCKLWWSETRGILAKTMEQWAKILRTNKVDAERLITYIENEQIGDVKRNGNGYVTLVSRRMVRDEKTRELTRLRVYKHRNKETCNADVTHDVTQMKHGSSSSSSCTKVHQSEISIPEWLEKDLWDDFREHRKKLRKPMTKRAEEMVLKKLSFLKDKGHNPQHLLMTALERGWQTVFDPDGEK